MPSVKGLLRSNTRMRKQIVSLKEEVDINAMRMTNSLGDLVQGAFAQANITSFNPAVQNNIYAPLTLNWQILTYMYKTHGILQTAIDVPVLDALRGGIEIKSDEMDEADIGELQDWMEEDGILQTVGDAMSWARLYGGAAIIVNTDQDPERPLDYNKPIKKLKLYAANRWELYANWKPNAGTQLDNPLMKPANKEDEHYYFYGTKIHRSRILTISGKTAPYIIRWQLQGWGMSEFERMIEDFNVYLRTRNVLYDLLEEAKVDVYKLEGFKAQLITAIGTRKTEERIALMNKIKNFNNALLLDKNDEYEQKQITFTGIAEVMKENRMGIASALRMPITKIFGVSASGFNSGEDDIENYNSTVESEVRTPMKPPLRKIVKLLCLAKFGTELDFKLSYHPLRVLSAVDEEAVKTSKQNRYIQFYDRSLLNSKEVGQMAQSENLVTIATEAAKGLLDDHPEMPGQEGEEGVGGDKDSKKGKKKEETKDE